MCVLVQYDRTWNNNNNNNYNNNNNEVELYFIKITYRIGHCLELYKLVFNFGAFLSDVSNQRAQKKH